jgi:hypothetical protein
LLYADPPAFISGFRQHCKAFGLAMDETVQLQSVGRQAALKCLLCKNVQHRLQGLGFWAVLSNSNPGSLYLIVDDGFEEISFRGKAGVYRPPGARAALATSLIEVAP